MEKFNVVGGRVITKDGVEWFTIKRNSINPVEADAMAHYIAEKLNETLGAEFEDALHDYKNS